MASQHQATNTDKPVLITRPGHETYTFDLDDIDGEYTFVNRGFSGCIPVAFSKPMDEDVPGVVTVEGAPAGQPIWATINYGETRQLCGIPLRGVLTEYDHTYTVRIEGLTDTDGNQMDPHELTVTTLPKRTPVPGYEAHDQVALDAAREGIVLLKNEGDLLPLPKDMALNVFGRGLWEFRIGTIGAGAIRPRYSVRLVDAIEEHSDFTLNPTLKELYRPCRDVVPSGEALLEACALSDVAIIVITRLSGENFDNSAVKGQFYLSDEEVALIEAVTGVFDKTVVILNTGYPMDVSWLETYGIKAVLYCSFPGMLGGQALVEILDGRVNPSGKLADTWSLDYTDIPASHNFYDPAQGVPPRGDLAFINTVYEENLYVGYRYFETFNEPVAYPFGHGLSYTTFALTPKAFEHPDGDTVRIAIEVRNIGAIPGKEVVQVYVEAPDGRLEQPSRRLVAFAKTRLLAPGEAETLALEMQAERFTSYDAESAMWMMEAGLYRLWVGASVASLVRAGSFFVRRTKFVKQVVSRVRPPMAIRTLSKRNPRDTYPKGQHSGLRRDVGHLSPQAERAPCDVRGLDAAAPEARITYPQLLDNPDLLGSFVKQLSTTELARLSVCAGAGFGAGESGEAGRVFLLDGYEMQDYVVADGNNSVSIRVPNIGMPCSNVVCASFNTELAYAVGRVIAEEAIELGVHMILAPGMNLHRNPLNGRHPEYYSEDPYLTGVMAGHQSKGLEEAGVSSCLKHVVANNCETARFRNHSLMTERALRELYLKPFEVAMQVHAPDAIMTSYNAVNGIYPAADPEVLQGIFREEFGFEGFAMTDWGSYSTVDLVEALQAGNTWMTPGSRDDTYVKPIAEGVVKGRIDRARLEENVYYLLRVMVKRHRQGVEPPG